MIGAATGYQAPLHEAWEAQIETRTEPESEEERPTPGCDCSDCWWERVDLLRSALHALLTESNEVARAQAADALRRTADLPD